MGEPNIVWADFRQGNDVPGIHTALPATWAKKVVDIGRGVDDAIIRHQPRLMCFDFDLPDQSGISILENTRRRHPLLPIVILMQDASVEMAVWALRLRVSDYFLKPIEIDALISKFKELFEVTHDVSLHGRFESHNHKTSINKVSTAIAASYIQGHLDEK